jgi:hypothetical protein
VSLHRQFQSGWSHPVGLDAAAFLSIQQEGSELFAFVGWLVCEAINKHGFSLAEVQTDFINVLLEARDHQLLLEVWEWVLTASVAHR